MATLLEVGAVLAVCGVLLGRHWYNLMREEKRYEEACRRDQELSKWGI